MNKIEKFLNTNQKVGVNVDKVGDYIYIMPASVEHRLPTIFLKEYEDLIQIAVDDGNEKRFAWEQIYDGVPIDMDYELSKDQMLDFLKKDIESILKIAELLKNSFYVKPKKAGIFMTALEWLTKSNEIEDVLEEVSSMGKKEFSQLMEAAQESEETLKEVYKNLVK